MSLIKYTGTADQVILSKEDFERVKVTDQGKVVFNTDKGFVQEVSESAAKYLKETEQGFEDASEEDRKEAEAKAQKADVPASADASAAGEATPSGSPTAGSPVTTTGGSTTKPAGGGAV